MSSPPASRMACPAVPRVAFGSTKWSSAHRVTSRVRLREPARRHTFLAGVEGSPERDQPPDASSRRRDSADRYARNPRSLTLMRAFRFIVPKLHSRSRASRRIGIARTCKRDLRRLDGATQMGRKDDADPVRTATLAQFSCEALTFSDRRPGSTCLIHARCRPRASAFP